MRVLIVEDDPELGDFLRRTLREAAWAADVVTDGPEALTALAVNEYDLAVLDVGLPGMDGFEVCRRHRARGGTTPILMLTARTALDDRLRGLDGGADDYLAKPFAVEELLARLRALARRPSTALDVMLRYADLELDPRTLTLRRGEATVRLTAREYALLEYLMRHPGRVLSRAQILAHVWDDNFDPVGNVVDVLVGRVRRRIAQPGRPDLIHSIRSRGYLLDAVPPRDAP
jgi:DNA-binding response OmpR family regulator